jgi:hypothetical protein
MLENHGLTHINPPRTTKTGQLWAKRYGPTTINPIAYAYYRSERIIEDLAIYCVDIFSSRVGGKDPQQAFEYLKSNFIPNGTIATARQADESVKN